MKTILEKALKKELDYVCENDSVELTDKQKEKIVQKFINDDYIGEYIDNELLAMIDYELRNGDK